jgi:hypothetical protein
MSYGGDDATLCELGAGGELTGWPLYATARVFPADLERFPALAECVSPDTSAEKRVLFLAPKRAAQVQPLAIQAICLPMVQPYVADTTIDSATRADAMRGLGPASLDFHPHSGARTLQNVLRVVDAVPAYRLFLGQDRESVRHIRDLLGRGRP